MCMTVGADVVDRPQLNPTSVQIDKQVVGVQNNPDARMNRLVRKEQEKNQWRAIQQQERMRLELEECTFTPNRSTTPQSSRHSSSPTSARSSSTPRRRQSADFVERNLEWAKRLQTRIEQERLEQARKAQEEVCGCLFGVVFSPRAAAMLITDWPIAVHVCSPPGQGWPSKLSRLCRLGQRRGGSPSTSTGPTGGDATAAGARHT